MILFYIFALKIQNIVLFYPVFSNKKGFICFINQFKSQNIQILWAIRINLCKIHGQAK